VERQQACIHLTVEGTHYILEDSYSSALKFKTTIIEQMAV